MSDIEARVKKIIAEQLGVAEEEVTAEKACVTVSCVISNAKSSLRTGLLRLPSIRPTLSQDSASSGGAISSSRLMILFTVTTLAILQHLQFCFQRFDFLILFARACALAASHILQQLSAGSKLAFQLFTQQRMLLCEQQWSYSTLCRTVNRR